MAPPVGLLTRRGSKLGPSLNIVNFFEISLTALSSVNGGDNEGGQELQQGVCQFHQFAAMLESRVTSVGGRSFCEFVIL